VIDRRLIDNFDWILLAVLIVLGLLGVFNLYSATYSVRSLGGGQIVVKQICWYAVGFLILLLMTTFDYHILSRLAYPLFFVFCLPDFSGSCSGDRYGCPWFSTLVVLWLFLCSALGDG